jgi:hypothetical protein
VPRCLAFACLLLVSACGTAQPDTGTPEPRHAAIVAATEACRGPWVSWSEVIYHSTWPYRTEVSETMRCLKDGSFVGPYRYRVDGL